MKNIIFDLGNVILDIDWSITEDRISALTGIAPDGLYTEHFDMFRKFETGKIPYVVFFNYLTKISNGKGIINKLLPAWNAMLLEIQPETWDVLIALSQKYNLYLLSNTNETHVQWFDAYLKEHGKYELWYQELFRVCYYSHKIGMRKPDAAIFHFVLDQHELNPAETIFIDDTLDNIKTAEKLGLHTIHFDRHTTTLRSVFEPWLSPK